MEVALARENDGKPEIQQISRPSKKEDPRFQGYVFGFWSPCGEPNKMRRFQVPYGIAFGFSGITVREAESNTTLFGSNSPFPLRNLALGSCSYSLVKQGELFERRWKLFCRQRAVDLPGPKSRREVGELVSVLLRVTPLRL